MLLLQQTRNIAALIQPNLAVFTFTFIHLVATNGALPLGGGQAQKRRKKKKKTTAMMIHKGGGGARPLVFSLYWLIFPGVHGASEGQILADTAPSLHWPSLLVDNRG